MMGYNDLKHVNVIRINETPVTSESMNKAGQTLARLKQKNGCKGSLHGVLAIHDGFPQAPVMKIIR